MPNYSSTFHDTFPTQHQPIDHKGLSAIYLAAYLESVGLEIMFRIVSCSILEMVAGMSPAPLLAETSERVILKVMASPGT
jgi:hypothetical protein